jgi:hypothetical protein
MSYGSAERHTLGGYSSAGTRSVDLRHSKVATTFSS